MELWTLQQITDGTISLAELEEEHPILGAKLKHFVETINRCCRDAYGRFSSALDSVLTLPAHASQRQQREVLSTLRDASDSRWFKEVAKICDDLAALSKGYHKDMEKIIESEYAELKRPSLQMMLMILEKHEGDLKEEIRTAVDILKRDIANSDIAGAQAKALSLKKEISSNLTRINVAATRITGSSSHGAEALLTREEIAERALRRPERVLRFNMAMVLVLVVVGAGAFQFLSIWQFPLLAGFIVTVLVVLNAFYLRSIDKLGEEPFIELIKLALLKFFAPLLRPQQPAREALTESHGATPPATPARGQRNQSGPRGK